MSTRIQEFGQLLHALWIYSYGLLLHEARAKAQIVGKRDETFRN